MKNSSRNVINTTGRTLNPLVNRALNGLSSNKYQPVSYEQLEERAMAYKRLSTNTLLKTRFLDEKARMSKLFSMFKHHRSMWCNYVIHLKHKVREWESAVSSWEEGSDEFGDFAAYNDLLVDDRKRDFVKFVEPVLELCQFLKDCSVTVLDAGLVSEINQQVFVAKYQLKRSTDKLEFEIRKVEKHLNVLERKNDASYAEGLDERRSQDDWTEHSHLDDGGLSVDETGECRDDGGLSVDETGECRDDGGLSVDETGECSDEPRLGQHPVVKVIGVVHSKESGRDEAAVPSGTAHASRDCGDYVMLSQDVDTSRGYCASLLEDCSGQGNDAINDQRFAEAFGDCASLLENRSNHGDDVAGDNRLSSGRGSSMVSNPVASTAGSGCSNGVEQPSLGVVSSEDICTMPLADSTELRTMSLADSTEFRTMPLADSTEFRTMPLADSTEFHTMPLADSTEFCAMPLAESAELRAISLSDSNDFRAMSLADSTELRHSGIENKVENPSDIYTSINSEEPASDLPLNLAISIDDNNPESNIRNNFELDSSNSHGRPVEELAYVESGSKKPNNPSSTYLVIPEEFLSWPCPDSSLRKSMIMEYLTAIDVHHVRLSDISARITGLEQSIMGFEEFEMDMILEQYPGTIPNRRNLVLHRLQLHFPACTRKTLQNVVNDMDQLRLLRDHKRSVREQWCREKLEILSQARWMFEDSCDSAFSQEVNEANKELRLQYNLELKRKLVKWKEKKARKRQLEEDIELTMRKHAFLLEKDRAEKECKQRAATKLLLSERRMAKQSEIQVQILAQQDELASLRENLALEAQRNSQRVDYRTRKLRDRIEDAERKKRREGHELLERSERLDKLRRLVSVQAESDPVRMMGHTCSTKAYVLGERSPKPQVTVGFTARDLAGDTRLKVETKLRAAGLHNTDYARRLIKAVPPPTKPRQGLDSSIFDATS